MRSERKVESGMILDYSLKFVNCTNLPNYFYSGINLFQKIPGSSSVNVFHVPVAYNEAPINERSIVIGQQNPPNRVFQAINSTRPCSVN